FLGFGIKVPMFPFHTWLPDAHVEAPTAGSMVLAGVLLKMGAYGFLRFLIPMAPDAVDEARGLVIALSLVAIVYGALVAMVQPDLKKLVAYSSVSHMGFVTLGIFTATQTGIDGALVQMLSHGVVSPALFFAVGVIYERAHTRRIDELGGLAPRMPIYATLFGFFMLASLGLPLLSGFVGEFLVLVGAFEYATGVGVLAALGVILAAAYMLWMYQRVALGRLRNQALATIPDVNRTEILTFVGLGVLVVWVGIFPDTFVRLLGATTAALAG
ncbi:MAG: NADH-quinone oxidoreductase subunit M, partial [Chloroflexota bacterium]|nr:NADH-quinone oxidoreductase subunit M [Chloroflexota bacterium]